MEVIRVSETVTTNRPPRRQNTEDYLCVSVCVLLDNAIVTNSEECSPRESDSRSAGKEILRLIWNLMVHHHKTNATI
jgi:hypothetical protein